MNKSLMPIALCTMIAGSCWAASEARADACMSLNENTEWDALINQMNKEAKAGKYDEALETIKKLDEICPNVPSVHYTAGMLYRKKNDNNNAFHHLTIATKNTKEFAVDEDLMKRMWFALYETEHPAVIDFLNGDTDSAYKKLIQGKDETIKNYQLKSEQDDKYTKIMMWTGAGVGITGVVLAVLGGVFMRLDGIPEYHNSMNNELFTSKYENNNYYAGTVLLGVGLSAAITGAIFAGIGGYRYTHKEQTSDEFDVSFSMSFNEASLQFTF